MKVGSQKPEVRSRKSPRRGVVLLVVLALVAIFGLIAVAFVVMTAQSRRGARSMARIGLVTDPPQKILQQAAMQVFRGPATNTSVMGAHSLLEALYGHDSISGTVAAGGASPACGGQLIAIPSGSVPAATIARRGGCVLTITSVPSGATEAQKKLVGQSSHIVGVNPDSGAFEIVRFPNGEIPPAGTEFTINGVPFSGTGFGFAADGTPLAGDLALQPNAAANRNPPGGANSDYTAADHQHMLLAAQVKNDSAPGGVQTLPSMHRPALVNYWNSRYGGSMTADQLRSIMLRPIGKNIQGITITGDLDHPDFDGSNPKFNPAWDGATIVDNDGDGQCDYAWDVDNDGDGAADSVWVDLGFPVRATVDGRLFKPLFAILCVDLDGRLNVNAHGSLQQVDANYTSGSFVSPSGGAIIGLASLASYSRGQGFGPAEINLSPLFSNAIYSLILQSRYGAPNGSGVPGTSGMDTLSQNLWFQYAQANGYGLNYWTFTDVNNAGSYGSPPDPFGVGAVGLDQAGRPVYVGFTTAASGDYVGFGSAVINNPYEMNFGPNVSRGLPAAALSANENNPFGPAEMERLLRCYDRDAGSLPARLAALTSSSGSSLTDSVLLRSQNKSASLSFTTDSWDLPIPAVRAKESVLEKLETHCPDRTKWGELLPPEMLVGLKMNINRPFGNGRADTGNNVVDDPTEGAAQPVDMSAQTVNPISFDGRTQTGTSLDARQWTARYLYVLGCLTADLSKIRSHLGGSATYDDVARFLAQWAVNVVDFRDRDSIMTSFDYDHRFADPNGDISGGWNPPGDPEHRVWGCERPELLISETLAFHDRRTEDKDNEDIDATEAGNENQTVKSTVDLSDPDKDHSYDQTHRPQGSLFVELYNPNSRLAPPSGDFCDISTGGVELTKVSVSGGDPVWRLVIAMPVDDLDPDDPDPAKQTDFRNNAEREVYFVNALPANTLGVNAEARFRPGANPGTIVVPPCGYAVIGSGEGTSKITFIGFENGQTSGNPSSTRHIDLAPSASNFPVRHNVNIASPPEPSTVNANTPQVLAINTPRRLSVSEPVGGYGSMETAGGPDPATGAYGTPYDVPFDGRRTDDGEIFARNGTTAKYRIIYLQRLANPLLPYDADANPYRTVDAMAVDVTAFNGLCNDADDPAQAGNTLATHFQSRQRGENNGTDFAAGNLILWKQEPANKTAWGTDADQLTDLHYFNYGLKHSLGYLNQPFGAPVVDAATSDKGLPSKPFPWLTWNNRPFVSPLELMLVSCWRSSQLLGRFTTATSGNPYTDAMMPFGHLTNYFLSDDPDAPDRELHRVFEYLGVPSPFIGAQTWVNPSPSLAASPYLPPFNAISNYREPGRVNLNTIYEKTVFDGLMAGAGMGAKPTWNEFIQSRRGSGGGILDAPGAAVPTEFAKPFRSFSGAALAPDAMKPTREINATILREGPTDGEPLFNYASSNLYDDSSRNPYFRYQALQRLGNLVTTRSNVYAVWITVGYFEVAPAGGVSAAHPDGYALGRELGIDTGEIERHRAFYIFDRSIPVGFQRGQDLNVEKAILINRFIE